MRALPLLLLAGGLTLTADAAPAPPGKADPSKAELKTLQGEWVEVASSRGGVPDPQPVSSPARLVITGDRMAYGGKDDSLMDPREWVIRLDVCERPKVFDTRLKGKWTRPKVYHGVYSLDRVTLTICFVVTGREKDRPKGLTGNRPGQYRRVFKRRKP
jgi:uncharacterized protein (TIGR03067 family)